MFFLFFAYVHVKGGGGRKGLFCIILHRLWTYVGTWCTWNISWRWQVARFNANLFYFDTYLTYFATHASTLIDIILTAFQFRSWYFWNSSSIVVYFQYYSYGYESRPYVIYIIYIQVAVLDFGLGVVRVNHPVKVSNPEGESQPTGRREPEQITGVRYLALCCCAAFAMASEKPKNTCHSTQTLPRTLEWKRQHSRGVFALMLRTALFTFQDTLLISPLSDFWLYRKKYIL